MIGMCEEPEFKFISFFFLFPIKISRTIQKTLAKPHNCGLNVFKWEYSIQLGQNDIRGMKATYTWDWCIKWRFSSFVLVVCSTCMLTIFLLSLTYYVDFISRLKSWNNCYRHPSKRKVCVFFQKFSSSFVVISHTHQPHHFHM